MFFYNVELRFGTVIRLLVLCLCLCLTSAKFIDSCLSPILINLVQKSNNLTPNTINFPYKYNVDVQCVSAIEVRYFEWKMEGINVSFHPGEEWRT